MARKSNSEKLSKDVESALEEALNLDLAGSDPIDDLVLDLPLDGLEASVADPIEELHAAAETALPKAANIKFEPARPVKLETPAAVAPRTAHTDRQGRST